MLYIAKVISRSLRRLTAQIHCAYGCVAGCRAAAPSERFRRKKLYHPHQPPLQALLLWQTLALAWLCGLAALRWPQGAALCLGLIFWADSRLHRAAPAVAALAIFGLGLGVCALAYPQRPERLPAPFVWTQDGPRLHGRVHSIQGLPDGRLRIVLDNVSPAAAPAAPAVSVPSATSAPPAASASAAPVSSDAPAASVPPAAPVLPGKVGWVWERPAFRPLPGQHLAVTLPLREARGLRNPGLGDSGQWWETQHVFWRMWSRDAAGQPEVGGQPAWGAAARQHLEQKLLDALNPSGTLTQGQAFLPALLFGDRARLSSQTMQHMAQASLVHSLALSGQHLALAALAGALLIRLLGGAHPALYLRVPRLKLMVLASLPPAALYLWMGGAPASLLRASCMLALLAWAVCRNRVAPLTDILLAAVCGITLLWPLGVYDTGLQLSVLCVAALALGVPVARRLPLPARSLPGRPLWLLPRWLCQICLVSLIIQGALLPVSLLLFGFVSPWFVLNVLWLPVLGVWVLPLAALGLAVAAADFMTAAHGLLWLAALPCDALLTALHGLAGHGLLTFPALLRPHWTALPAWAALLAALALLPGRASLPRAGQRLAVAGMLLLCVGPLLRLVEPWTAPLRLAVLDVGQGQALSLHLPGGQRLLVDGGGSSSPRFDPGRDIAAPLLAHNAGPRLHAVVSTHPDSDHLRGLGHVLRTFDVEHFFHNGENPRPDGPADLRAILAAAGGSPLYAGMTLELPGNACPPLRLEVLHPPAGGAFTGNDASLVLRLAQGERGLALLTGDAEKAALRHVLDSGRDVRADVLVLPHHGSRNSLLPAFYDAVQPQLALASCGRDNRYGYPAPAVAQALRQRGIALYSTGEHGYMEVRWDRKGAARLALLPE